MVVFTSLIAYLIPDIPAKVKKQIRRAAYISNEIVIKAELDKARQSRPSRDIVDVIGSFAAKAKKNDTSNGSGLRKRSDEKSPPETAVVVDDVSVSNI